ncbi:MAG: hypothetical protein EBZ69_00070 [Alphaproteobacteria bacterium]|nr:hypothetical protein [Alphaproteobacteria bacterium]
MNRPDSFKQIDDIRDAEPILRRSLSDVLNAREKPLALFTPALLITHGGFDRDPAFEFNARFPAESPDLKPFYTELQREEEFFFRGLGRVALPGFAKPVAWDKRLYCIDASRAEECFSFIGGIAFSNPKTGMFASVFSYDTSIPDPTSFSRQWLQVKIFGVVSNSFVVFLEERGMKPPQARRIDMSSASASVSFLRQKGLLSSFTEDDPLKMRD